MQEKCFEPFLDKNLPVKRSSAFKKAMQATVQEREAVDKVVDVRTVITTTTTTIINIYIYIILSCVYIYMLY